MLRREITDVRLQVTEREEEDRGMLLRNDEREYERDKTELDGELERGWEEGGGDGGWKERGMGEKSPFSGRAGPIRLYRLIMQIVRLWDK